MIKFILLCFGFVIMLGLLLGFSVLRMFKRVLFGSDSNKRQQTGRRTTNTNSSRQNTRQQHTNPPRKKIIDKDEGEYVDYEEVK